MNQLDLLQILEKLQKLDFLIVSSIQNAYLPFSERIPFWKIKMFSHKRFVEYLYTVFVCGPQTPKHKTLYISPGLRRCVCCIKVGVRPGLKKMVVNLLDTQIHYLQ